jgi:hypothetical protein
MRMLVSAFLLLWSFLCGNAFASGCHLNESQPEALAGPFHCFFDEDRADESASSGPYSTFRGISLASRPEDVQRIGHALGFEVDTSLFIGGNAIAGVSFYADCQSAVQADFDRQGRMLRLSFKDRFFCDRPMFVRRFADALFERYGVTPTKVDDDVCFQDVTCFKGVSKHGERFLILRIGTDAGLYVRP